MVKFFKQKLILFIIFILEKIINNNFLTKVFIFLSERFKNIIFWNINKNIFNFKNLSIAFIADGNRRFCKNNKIELDLNPGIKVIQNIIKFSFFHQIKEVSFFLFSVRNFKRPENEISKIMKLGKNNNIFNLNIPIRIKVFGNINLLDEDVKSNIKKYVEDTKFNKGMIVNLFIGYSSSYEEMYNKNTKEDLGLNNIYVEEFKSIERSKENFSNYSNECKKNKPEIENSIELVRIGKDMFKDNVDLLIRTGGEKRLSDFMVKQVANGTAIDFIEPLWPEFTLIHLNLCLYKYFLEEKYLRNIN